MDKIKELKVAIGAVAKVKKPKEPKRLKIALGMDKLSKEACEAVYSLSSLLCVYDPLTVDDLLERFTLLKKECGGDAKIKLTADGYFGDSADITWYRDETDEEMEKRLKRNKKIAATKRKLRAAAKTQKIVDEKVELERLKKKYPKEV